MIEALSLPESIETSPVEGESAAEAPRGYNHPEVFDHMDIVPVEDSERMTYEIPGVGVLSLFRLEDYGGKRVLQVDIAEVDEDKIGGGYGQDMYRYVATHLPPGYQGILSGTITHDAVHNLYETLGKDPGFRLQRIGNAIRPSMYLLEPVESSRPVEIHP